MFYLVSVLGFLVNVWAYSALGQHWWNAATAGFVAGMVMEKALNELLRR